MGWVVCAMQVPRIAAAFSPIHLVKEFENFCCLSPGKCWCLPLYMNVLSCIVLSLPTAVSDMSLHHIYLHFYKVILSTYMPHQICFFFMYTQNMLTLCSKDYVVISKPLQYYMLAYHYVQLNHRNCIQLISAPLQHEPVNHKLFSKCHQSTSHGVDTLTIYMNEPVQDHTYIFSPLPPFPQMKTYHCTPNSACETHKLSLCWHYSSSLRHETFFACGLQSQLQLLRSVQYWPSHIRDLDVHYLTVRTQNAVHL